MTKMNMVVLAVVVAFSLLAVSGFVHNTTMAVQNNVDVFTVDIYK